VYTTIQAVKYIYKYVYKGSDCITLVVSAIDNKITYYIQGQYIGLTEAYWQLIEFLIYQEYSPIQQLAIYLEGQYTVYFADNLIVEQIAIKATASRLTLMAFFLYNTEHKESCQYLYQEFL
jgi:hypothetical protein